MLLASLITTLIISAVAFIFNLILYKKNKFTKKYLLVFVSLSTGTLLGGAFFHLLSEAHSKIQLNNIYNIVIISFIFYFALEKIIHWRHCHTPGCKIHSFGYLNLIGDGLHNFIDGLIIITAFYADFRLGIAAAAAIAFHEIPQEIGDYSVLILSGIKKTKALIINTLVSLTSILGIFTGYFLFSLKDDLLKYLLPFAAGGFIYIAMSDLIPEIKGEKNKKKSLLIFSFFILGIIIMKLLTFLEFE